MEIFQELLQRIPLQWLLAATFFIWVFGQTGLIQRLTRWRSKVADQSSQERIREADRLSEDQKALITALEEQVKRERDWRLGEYDYYKQQLLDLRHEVENLRGLLVSHNKLIEVVESSERGNARLRHALNNVLQYVVSLRVMMAHGGLTAPSFNGLRDMMGISADLDETLRRVFEELGVAPPAKGPEDGS